MNDQWLRRLAWGLALYTVIASLVATVWLFWAADYTRLNWLEPQVRTIVNLGAPILGLIIVRQQPRQRVGWLFLILGVLVSGAQVYRYVRVFGPAERKQIRWFLFGLFIFIVPTSILDLVTDYPAEVDALTFMALPIGIGISILRYRLWNIDVIIRQTLVYALLSGLLALVYFGSVVLLQTVIGRAADEQSPLVIVVSTLLIAALFAPLRRRVQAFIDRRFFRTKYDAQQILAQFAQTARDEVEMDVLQAELLRVVQKTLQSLQALLCGCVYLTSPKRSASCQTITTLNRRHLRLVVDLPGLPKEKAVPS